MDGSIASSSQISTSPENLPRNSDQERKRNESSQFCNYFPCFYSIRLYVLVLSLSCLVTVANCRENRGVKYWWRKRHCPDLKLSLEDRVRNADFIITGHVDKIYDQTPNEPNETALVYVHRIIKGDRKKSLKKIRVHGFGDGSICRNRVRIRMTTIFLLHQVSDDNQFKLNSSLLSLKLDTMDKLYAAVNSIPYIPRKPIKAKPCERILCPFGGICHTNGTVASCQCSHNCVAQYLPVCGNDNVTYPNLCQLTKQMCRSQSKIQIQYKGTCESRDPCELKECKFGASCIRSMDGRTADCVCPAACPNYGDSRGSQPVCANDAKDYDSLCEMKRASCENKLDIQVKYVGRCDPCANVSCSDGTICKLDPRRQPKCRCNERCGLEYRPICASDGKTYHNVCFMRVAGCKDNNELRVIYHSRCQDGSNPCRSLSCDYGEQCYVDSYNVSSCQCLHICEPVMRPVCGIDAVTYDNTCELERTACRQRLRTTVLHQGSCGYGPCAKHECHTGAICIMRNDQPTCQCPICTDELNPVCGNNGITYINKCKLDQEACALRKEIHIRYHDWCNGCEGKECDFHAVCVSNRAGEGKCMCPAEDDCPADEQAVCATDGNTYANECQMKRIACLKRVFIIKASQGACDSCAGVSCLWGAQCRDGRCVCPKKCPKTNPKNIICASDGKLYRSKCNMERAACERGMTMTDVDRSFCSRDAQHGDVSESECNEWSCSYGGMCTDLNGLGAEECLCDFFHCADVPFEPVCGTDYTVYSSTCSMDRTSCNLQAPIYPQPMQKCLDKLEESYPAPKLCFVGKENNDNLCVVSRVCECNRLGSLSSDCDTSGHCSCRPGVGGKKCDQCLPAFWGIHLIATGNIGCQPCGCSAFGSQRDDCEQTTGRCVCRKRVSGNKCDSCPNDFILSSIGCVHLSEFIPPRNCAQVECHHGAHCIMQGNAPMCMCPEKCTSLLENMEVCGSDGLTYSSLCYLKQSACKSQRDTVAVALGPCPKLEKSSINSRQTEGEKLTEPYWRQSTKAPKLGQLGSRCYGDWDCKIIMSVCAEHVGKQVCLCKRGYIPAEDNSKCVEFVTPESNSLSSPCFDSPCRNSGTCIAHVKHGRKFQCRCTDKFTGDLCQYRALKHLYTLPQFSGDSYLEFNRLDAYSHVTIEMEFKPEEMEGVLLYNAQFTDAPGDFIALVIKDSIVEFRYNLGDGPIILQSNKPVVIDEWHTVVASRTDTNSSLKVDDEYTVSSPLDTYGKSKHLNLKTTMMLGNVIDPSPSTVSNLGTIKGFEGCIRSLKINEKVFDLRLQLSGDILTSHAMGECGVNPCSSLPCLNGASCSTTSHTAYQCVCSESFTGIFCETALNACVSSPCQWGGTCRLQGKNKNEFVCLCPIGRTGRVCEQDEESDSVEEVVIPSFYGDGFLELPHLPAQSQSALSFELWIRPIKPDGILLFSADSDEFLGYSGKDFLALILQNGYPQFMFNLGKGVASILSKTRLEMDEWHSIKVDRYLRNASLTVNGGTAVIGEAPVGLTKLNLDSFPLYIGGVRDPKIIPPSVPVSSGFFGAIQKLSINSSPYKDLVKASFLSSGLGKYEGAPCTPGICLHNGICVPRLNNYICRCPAKYSGQRCELKLQSDSNEGKPVYFNGNTQLVYQNKITDSHSGQRTSKFSIQFRTSANDGLLWWENKGLYLNGDYLAVAITGNKISLAYNLGKETKFNSRTLNKNVSDGQWHTLKFNRVKRQGSMSIDGESEIAWVSTDGATELNTDGLLWIGGKESLPNGLPSSYYHSFVGCISEVYIDDKLLNLQRDMFRPPKTDLLACPD